jgi:seryl-tRNA synthetase
MFSNEVLEEERLPIYYTAYTACFRREAGSYGKETKGLVRVHQFDKVELVKFVKPDGSYFELERLVNNAEQVLQLLNLPYRVVALSTEDLSFAASKCYDLEAYASGLDMWLEVSSCSNFEAFQARRANIRYRRKDKRIDYPHTLNGSGVALARTMICLLENHQQSDGSMTIPEALRPYLDGKSAIPKP